MAKFGIDVTGMSGPNLGAASHISEGVVDRSGALRTAATTGLIENTGHAAVNAYHGYNLADVEKKTESVITDYMNRTHPSLERVVNQDLTSSEQSLFTKKGATQQELSPVEAKLGAAYSKYQAALAQGVMSPDEFHTRTLAVLRNAVNQNPGMMQELSDQANKVLELSGIKGIVKADQEASQTSAKAEESLQKYYRDIAKSFNIPLPVDSNGAVDYTALKKSTDAAQMEQFIVDEGDKQNKFTEQQFRHWGPTYVNGKLNKTIELIMQNFDDPSIPVDKAISNAKTALQTMESNLDGDSRIGSIIDKPVVAETMKNFHAQVGAVIENLTAFHTKADLAKYMQNLTSITRDQQTQDTMKSVNITALGTLSQLVTALGPSIYTSNPELKVKIVNGLAKLTEGLPVSGSSVTDNLPNGNPPPAVSAVTQQAGRADIKDNSNAQESLSNTIVGIDGTMSKMQLPEKFTFLGKYVKMLGSPTNKDGLSTLSDDARTRATSHVSDYAAITFQDMGRRLNELAKDGHINVDILPDGRLTMSSPDGKITNELTKRYVTRVNDALRAYTNVKGYGSTKEAAKDFYAQYKEFFSPTVHDTAQSTSGKIQ